MIYAKQVNPEYVDTTYYLESFFEESDYVIDGGKHYYGYNDALINNAKSCVEYLYEMEYGYHANITEFLEYYLHVKLNTKQVGLLKRELYRNDLSTTPYEENFILAVLNAVKHKEYKKVYLRGCSQGDVVKLYAPIDTPADVINYIEALYWNLGSELIIHDEDSECESADDVCGYGIYVDTYNTDKLKEAVAHEMNCKEEDIKLWVFSGYTRLEKYELA